MFSLRKWIGPAAVFGLAVLVFSASIANGQNPYDRLHRALVASRGAAPSMPVHMCSTMSCMSVTGVLL